MIVFLWSYVFQSYFYVVRNQVQIINYIIKSRSISKANFGINHLRKVGDFNLNQTPSQLSLSCVFNAHLVLLFNQILSMCVIHKSFRTSCSCVTPLYKGSGPRNHCNSFRPISVLNPVTKVFKFILFARLRLSIEPLLSIQQHGFRKWFSCHTALLCFTQEIYKAIDLRNGRVGAGAVFVDLPLTLLITLFSSKS